MTWNWGQIFRDAIISVSVAFALCAAAWLLGF
jgi:hypothetical protein